MSGRVGERGSRDASYEGEGAEYESIKKIHGERLGVAARTRSGGERQGGVFGLVASSSLSCLRHLGRASIPSTAISLLSPIPWIQGFAALRGRGAGQGAAGAASPSV
jgi:hypothetical protein